MFDYYTLGRQDRLKNLISQGYKFEIDANYYMVWHNKRFIHGAGVKLPREKPLHWKHAQANRKDNLEYALLIAEKDRSNLCLKH